MTTIFIALLGGALILGYFSLVIIACMWISDPESSRLKKVGAIVIFWLALSLMFAPIVVM